MNQPKHISLIGHFWRWLLCVSVGTAVGLAISEVWDWYFGNDDPGMSHNAIFMGIANVTVVYFILVLSNKRRAG